MIAALHGHHNCLVSFYDTLEDRIIDIKENKPVEEQALRLRLISEIPLSELPPEVVEKWQAYKAAGQTAWRAWLTGQAAWRAYQRALADHRDELEALHTRYCVMGVDCPWDGESIFPGKEE